MITFGQLHISVKSCNNKMSIMGKKKKKLLYQIKFAKKKKYRGYLEWEPFHSLSPSVGT